MNCIVTAGPTYEELDEVRRLTNFSTGRLGSELAAFLQRQGHEVHLLLGHYATWRKPFETAKARPFTTTADLRAQLHALASAETAAVFHAAAVSDFAFGKIFARGADGALEPVSSPKIPTRGGALLAELVPTPKIIAELRGWFPRARVVGWKYELDGGRADAVARAQRQVVENHIDVSVANGRAYGEGFGVVDAAGQCAHYDDRDQLFSALAALIR